MPTCNRVLFGTACPPKLNTKDSSEPGSKIIGFSPRAPKFPHHRQQIGRTAADRRKPEVVTAAQADRCAKSRGVRGVVPEHRRRHGIAGVVDRGCRCDECAPRVLRRPLDAESSRDRRSLCCPCDAKLTQPHEFARARAQLHDISSGCCQREVVKRAPIGRQRAVGPLAQESVRPTA
jgi:hypothetical protein